MTGGTSGDAAATAAELRRRGVLDVDTSVLARTLYSSDASTYRVPPALVVFPRQLDELDAIAEVAALTGMPLTMRGAGTSIAGNSIGPGMVVETRRHLTAVGEVDGEEGTVWAQPGAVHAEIQRKALQQGWRLGPDPSTHTRCTIGGMVGNNACGTRALGYGTTAQSLRAVRSTPVPWDELRSLAVAHRDLIQAEFGLFSRQISGYAVHELLGTDPHRILAGSEGTLALIKEVELQLVREPEQRLLVALGFADMVAAAHAVPQVLVHQPVACEGLDQRLVALAHPRIVSAARALLPPGQGWLLVELAGQDAAELRQRAAGLVAELGCPHTVVADGEAQRLLWSVREDGAGLAARATTPRGQPGWEDAAVPAHRLGAYLAALESLITHHQFDGIPYGHFGEGCVHLRINFSFDSVQGRRRYRDFIEAAADLTVAHGGSMSGEHGDGRARSELLAKQYSPAAMALQRQIKHSCDPAGVLNPGVLIDADPFDHQLRTQGSVPPDLALLAEHADRCTGVGKCLVRGPDPAAAMCPSYRVTGQEQDGTRGRSRVLQELTRGELVLSVSDPAVTQALELCLGCQACARDCPSGVDMAEAKSLVLEQRYAGRRRPRLHYTVGRLPWWLARTPSWLLRRTAQGRRARWVSRLAGVDARRTLPLPQQADPDAWAPWLTETDPSVVIWVDSMTQHFRPDAVTAAARLLQARAQRVLISVDSRCCGLTWAATGQRRRAEELLRASAEQVETLSGARGIPVVVLEPSCLARLRSQGVSCVRSLAEVLQAVSAPDRLPSGTGTRSQVIFQSHCHQRAVLGVEADVAQLRAAGHDVTVLTQCCGMAGHFGLEAEHYDVSVGVAELELLPAIRAAQARGQQDVVVVADGVSCRAQAADLGGVQAQHLAEVLAASTSWGSGPASF